MAWWTGYDTRPMGGSNPYYCCVGCGITDPSINGDINRHGAGCTEVARYLRELNKIDTTPFMAEGAVWHLSEEYEYEITVDGKSALIKVTLTTDTGMVVPLCDDEFTSLERASETFRDAVSLLIARKILDDAGVDRGHIMWKLGDKG